MARDINLGPTSGPFVNVQENNGDLDVSTPNGAQYTFAESPSNNIDIARLQDVTDFNHQSDGNSPFTASQSASITCNLADTYDEWIITAQFDNFNTNSSATDWRITLNGNNNNVYTEIDVLGGETNNKDNIIIAKDQTIAGSGSTTATFTLDGRFGDDGVATCTFLSAKGDEQTNSQTPIIYGEGDVTPPINSFTITNRFSEKSDIKVVAVGRDV